MEYAKFESTKSWRLVFDRVHLQRRRRDNPGIYATRTANGHCPVGSLLSLNE